MTTDLQTIELLKKRYPNFAAKQLDGIGDGDRLFVFGDNGEEVVGDFQGLIEYCRDHEVSPRNLQIVSMPSAGVCDGFRVELTEEDIADIERDACLS